MRRSVIISLFLLLSLSAFSKTGEAGSLGFASTALCGSRLWAAVETDTDATLAFSDNGGGKWKESTIPSQGKARSIRPMLWSREDGSLWLFYSTMEEGGTGRVLLSMCQNPSAREPLWESPIEIGAGIVSGEPLILGSRILVPCAIWGGNRSLYGNAGAPGYALQDSPEGGAGFILSDDSGESWSQVFHAVSVPELSPGRFNNPVVTGDGSGRLSMYLRSSGTGWAYRSISTDGGTSWMPPSRFVLNPDSGFSLRRLRSGRLLLVKSSRFDNLLYYESEGMFAYLSEDNGRSWYGGLRLDTSENAREPYVIESPEGKLLISWTTGSEILLARTSEEEIDASTANRESAVRSRSAIFKAGRWQAVRKELQKPLLEPRGNWSKDIIKIGTYNIQYRNSLWPKPRLKAVSAILDTYNFDVFGAQEPYLTQIQDIIKVTDGRYAWVGDCTDGKNQSESTHYNPIFYLKDRFELEDWGTVWFTPAPGEPGYDAFYSRNLTWARLRQRSSGKSFYCFNSHFDHVGIEADRMSARILIEAVRSIAGGLPAFLTGDFNSDEKSPTYSIIIQEPWLQDSMEAVSDPENAQYFSMSRYKPMSTVAQNHLHIDHIFYTPNSSRILSWKLITDSIDGNFGSDHLPIIAEWKIAN